MDVTVLIPGLALVTLVAVAVFALISRKKTIEAMNDPNHVKSTLAADTPDRHK